MELPLRIRLAEILQLLLVFSRGNPAVGTFLHSHGKAFEGSEGRPHTQPWEPPPSSGPVFDPSPPHNVTAVKGENAYLHCIVYNLGNNTVSWIRDVDLHILTVAQYTYTADDRFEVIHSPDSNSNSWILKIKSVQPRDSGRYECQVNTHPTDPITFPVYLSVFVPTARILGSPERYVYRGSTINLTCIINHKPESTTEIFWYHNNKVINYDNRDSRVSVITDRGAVTKTILLIHDAHDGATGTYSCVPSPSATASVRIHILNGDSTAAILTNTGRPCHLCPATFTFALALLTCLLCDVTIRDFLK
ncbi:zwei Ig domain protein zig-8-like [Penaeus monodon]|uniref:zwei Ig domain protein zig-8-like n=1 Tax=Penaeus monodon TaxID=6687 RepID=UPI0018A71CE0|nr:zwei Ig domain protein zig-8-like [Penaeus monodon]XP_037787701.1 zwei Ig domain protein zig-8-like [Penaeus monodon]XP_037787709.1 zwei Ig domain protein zig-8-like [Penaeus monodon]